MEVAFQRGKVDSAGVRCVIGRKQEVSFPSRWRPDLRGLEHEPLSRAWNVRSFSDLEVPEQRGPCDLRNESTRVPSHGKPSATAALLALRGEFVVA